MSGGRIREPGPEIWKMKNTQVNLTLKINNSEPETWLVAYGLSQEEVALMAMIKAGRSERKMAEILQISYPTITDQVRRICKKLGVRNRAMVKAMILREGLLPGFTDKRCPTCGASSEPGEKILG